MKELSIEEKAKRYDEAIERVKGMHERDMMSERLEYIFPELKESEDERIKEDIISYIQLANQFIPQFQKDKWIAWLEKQGEQKPIDPDTLIQQRLDALADIVADQKPTDKVEPKFHEGDLVVDNCGYVWKIEGILNQFYLLEGVEGGESRPTIEWVNKTFHLWTIQDAKDGDVLATLDYILIFKEFLKNDGGISYCHYDFGTGNPQFIWFEDKNWYFGKEAIIYPATKEQRDLLFQKMKEAGYEWDAEKKELKEIEQKSVSNQFTPEQASILDKHIDKFLEQKSADKIEPKFKVGDIISNGTSEVKIVEVNNNSYSVTNDEIENDCNPTNWVVYFKDQDNWKLFEQKSTKNKGMNLKEEEMTPFQKEVFNIIDTNIEAEVGLKQECDILLSLASNEIEQTPAWSEEDERTYKSITYSFAHNYPLTVQQQEFVKSLKDRYTWKPSDKH